jgi:predicted AAA+ superfamily ATPase
MSVGGFSEPFLDNSPQAASRWRSLRFDQILQEEIQSLESIRQLQTVKLLVDILSTRVGGPIVFSKIANELQVAPRSVKHWIEILERMYFIFLVYPYSKNMPKAIQKPPKVYFFDNGDVMGDEGAKFENLVATHILKRLQFQEDAHGFR